jgi:hypothetical protein
MPPALTPNQKIKWRNWRDDSVQLRALFALAQEISLIHSTHMVAQKDLMPFSGILGLQVYLWYIDKYTSKIPIHITFFFFFFENRVSLYSPDCPGTHFVDQAGLELRNPPASASQVLGLKACASLHFLKGRKDGE